MPKKKKYKRKHIPKFKKFYKISAQDEFLIEKEKLRLIYAGDLLAQTIASSFGIMGFHRPVYGLYGACATMGEALSLASMAVAGGYGEYVLPSNRPCGAAKILIISFNAVMSARMSYLFGAGSYIFLSTGSTSSFPYRNILFNPLPP